MSLTTTTQKLQSAHAGYFITTTMLARYDNAAIEPDNHGDVRNERTTKSHRSPGAIILEEIKELLSTLTSDQRWGVILKFEDFQPDKFAQLVADAPQWTNGWGDCRRFCCDR